ncbi:hypothetical protein tb265_02900 [Gemmatimonadetes bacterium T265]|nr:hypothetical protein tb265_02900 [Gemmatimonadetes bacterium T265]
MRAGVLVLVAIAAGAGACVHVDAAPNGITSVRLGFAPPAIALGDSLRDTLGNAIPVHGLAYDASGRVVPTAQFRYAYVPSTPDTTGGATIDAALVVDSATGAVRAAPAYLTRGDGTRIVTGRVVASIGSNLQLADTLQIVLPPDTVVVTAPTDTVLRYTCADPGTSLFPDTTLPFKVRNAAGPFTVTVQGDSAKTQVGVPRWLVRWSIDSVVPAFPIPTVAATPLINVPAIAISSNAADQIIGYDTTNASGVSSVRLRIRPKALGPSLVDTSFRVVLRADVIVGHRSVVPGSGQQNVFAVRLSRVASTACAQ